MSTDLSKLLAIEAIKNVRKRYCHFLDTNQMDALAQLFTTDAICEVDRGVWRGREAIREGLSQAFAAFDTQNSGRYPFLHVIANQWVELLDDDRAQGRCYLIDLVTTRPPQQSPFLLLGLYADEYRLVDGHWFISRTRLDVVWPERNGGGGDPGSTLVLPE